MGRRRSVRGQQPQVKGFRAGKQPKSLSKRALKQQMPEMNRAQERLVDLFADRSPEESLKLVGQWHRYSLLAGIVLSVLSVLGWTWSWIAGVLIALPAAAAFFIHLQIRGQRSELEQMAEAVSRATRGR